MISHRHRCIFVHIPRCGGSSVEAVLWPRERTASDLWMGFVEPGRNRYQSGGLQHLTAQFIRQEVGDEIFYAYFTFAVVRNPFDKAVSQYAFLRRRPDLRALLGLSPAAGFKEYLRAIGAVPHVQWMPQHAFIFEGDTLAVQRIVRFERFETEIGQIFTELGESAAVPRLHGSERLPLCEYYDDEAVDLVSRIYARDLDLLGYACPQALQKR